MQVKFVTPWWPSSTCPQPHMPWFFAGPIVCGPKLQESSKYKWTTTRVTALEALAQVCPVDKGIISYILSVQYLLIKRITTGIDI